MEASRGRPAEGQADVSPEAREAITRAKRTFTVLFPLVMPFVYVYAVGRFVLALPFGARRAKRAAEAAITKGAAAVAAIGLVGELRKLAASARREQAVRAAEREARRGLRREVPTQSVYARDCPGMMQPARTPFDASVRSGAFLYLTTQRWTYLLERTPSAREVYSGARPASFSAGYAALWIMERSAVFPGGEPRLWPELPVDAPGVASYAGAFVVFKDPVVQFTETRGDIVVITEDRTQAERVAEAFAAEYGVATCVARIVSEVHWH